MYASNHEFEQVSHFISADISGNMYNAKIHIHNKTGQQGTLKDTFDLVKQIIFVSTIKQSQFNQVHFYEFTIKVSW